MLFVYGVYMPLRWMEEIQFWKTQEKEHTVVIREIVPDLEAPYVQLLQEWEPIFARTEQHAASWLQQYVPQAEALPEQATSQVHSLLKASAEQSREFIRHLQLLMQQSEAVRSKATAQTVVLHIIRESEYFLNVLSELQKPPLARASDPKAEEVVPIGGHKLPPLPYGYDALAPYIDEPTMRIHHSKHHQSYVDGLNKAEKELAQARTSGQFDLVKHWQRELAFHGAGHYLHTLFWDTMSPQGGGSATGPIGDQITADFGSFAAFKKHFSEAAEKVEGGGWAILVWSPRSRRLEILQAEKHQNLSQWDIIPLLPLDVWEHAYYLKHQNKRADYIKDWWNVVNWPYVNERFLEASRLRWEPY